MNENDRKKKEGYLIAPFIIGWLLVWYNHVWIQWPVGYWKWVALSIPLLLIPDWLRKPIMGIVFAVAAVCQVAHWLGLVNLPLIH